MKINKQNALLFYTGKRVMKFIFLNVNIYIYIMYKEAAVACIKQLNCTKIMVVVVVIITDKI